MVVVLTATVMPTIRLFFSATKNPGKAMIS